MHALKKLTFSIVVPSFNQGHFIEETLQSVINQTYKEVELIVIDGASTDNTVEVIKKYANYITYWVSEPDSGQSDAINKGFKKATGDIVTWLNSDDAYVDNALELANNYFSNNENIGMLHGKTIVFGSGRKDEIIGGVSEDVKYKYLAYIPFPQPSSFIRKSVLDAIGGVDERLHYGMDFDLESRVFLNYDVLAVDDLFSRYRMHEASKSNELIRFAEDWHKVFCRNLRGVESANFIISFLEENNYYHNSSEINKASKNFDSAFMHKTFCFFLLNQFHYYYQALDFKMSNKIGGLLKKFDNDFYSRKGLLNEILKSKFIGKKGISLLRKLR